MLYSKSPFSAQFKNKKQFSNIPHHHKDFGSKATWLFTATSHGKSACDAIGGNLKGLATTESINKGDYNTILNAAAFMDFVLNYKTSRGENLKTIPLLVTPEEIKETAKKMKPRWDSALPIQGTQSYHHFEPDPNNEEFVVVKHFSNSDNLKKLKIHSM